ncbi:diguanylate cyclase [Cellulomonas sp. KRMCY2]|uniref:GGDEF domain-containing protein n=1 Tax=Cellulomonas sp. KRMCY2 TaxID=1304865 RepID=UPI00045EA8AF|nr:GGDEF domain-containing protein [Cellulomonas sp. KRMCY2]
MNDRRRHERLEGIYRDNLNALLRRVLVIALAAGFPTIVVMIVLLGPTDPVVAWGFPPLLVFLAVYAWVLLRRPDRAVDFSRVSVVVAEVAWVAGMLYRLLTADDIHDGWHSLFPTTFMGMIIFTVVGFLVCSTRLALLNSLGSVAAILGAGLFGLLRVEGGSEHVLDLVRYTFYLGFVALLLHVLSRAKSRLAVAIAAAQQANDEALQMRDMAYLDALTGIANRRRLFEELTYQSDRVAEHGPVAVLYFDLDGFKAINDEHGHSVGDEVLCRVAELAGRLVRKGDLVARLGGEEFVIVAPGTGRERAVQLAERLRTVLPAELTSTVGVRVTASFGVAELHAGEAASDVLGRVDALMYSAKSGGRDRVVSAAS